MFLKVCAGLSMGLFIGGAIGLLNGLYLLYLIDNPVIVLIAIATGCVCGFFIGLSIAASNENVFDFLCFKNYSKIGVISGFLGSLIAGVITYHFFGGVAIDNILLSSFIISVVGAIVGGIIGIIIYYSMFLAFTLIAVVLGAIGISLFVNYKINEAIEEEIYKKQ